MTKRKTNEQFLRELKLVNKNVIPDEPYVTASTRISCHCAICGFNWVTTPNTLLSQKSGCPNCAGHIKKTTTQFVEELSYANPNIEVLGDYQNSVTPLLCRCKICGNEWNAKPRDLLKSKYGCPQCKNKQNGLKRKKSNEEFVKELSLINDAIIPLEPYVSSSKKIKCKCKICNYCWYATPNNLLSKRSGCPNCTHTTTSIVEQIILKSFSIELGEDAVLSRDRKEIGKELDIYIPELNLAIEFGAWFWHKDKIQNDNEKQKLCSDCGIHLISILEYCPDFIDEQLIGDYRLFKQKLSAEKDFHSTKILIKNIFDDYQIPFSEVEKQWDSIIKDSIVDARNKSEEKFIKDLNKLNPSIEYIGGYTKSDEKVYCKCKECGYEWHPFASSLLRGHTCPKCAIKRNTKNKRYTNKEFLLRLAKVNANIEPLEPYVKSDVKIQCKCKKCGHIWQVKPSNLLFGNGCPKCAREHITSIQSKAVRCVETGEVFSSIAEVYRQTGTCNVIKCLKGRQETAGGYHWEYVND